LGVAPPCIDAATVVSVDGQPFDVAHIPDGAVAIVRDVVTDNPAGTHQAVDIQRTVVGTIESVDVAHARLSVLGQQIYVSDITRIAGNGALGSLAVGDRILISGFFSPNGEVVATAISHDAGGNGFVLRGILHITDSGLLRIGQMGVGSVWDYSFDGFPGNTPVEGDPVLVFADAAPEGNALSPNLVQFAGGELGESPVGVRSIQGLISDRPSPSEMSVEGRPVDCAFFRCEDATQAQIGTLVDVLQTGGVGEVRVLDPTFDTILLVGPVGAANAQDGSMSVLGFPIQISPAAAISDQSGQPMRVGDLAIGDTVAVEGGAVGDVLVAGRINAAAANLQIIARNVTFDEPAIHLLGRTILTNQATTVSGNCEGEMDLRWLFDVAAKVPIATIHFEVSQTSTDELLATRVEVLTVSCDWTGS
jgi:hypothetical protein